MTSTSADIALLDATAQADLVRRGEVTARRAGRGGDRADRAAQPDAQRRGHADVRPGARRGRAAGADGPVRRRAVPAQGPRRRGRRRAASPRARGSCAATSPPTTASWSRGCERAGPGHPRQDQHARSSAWRRPASRRCSARPATRGTPTGRPAARAAARPRRSRPAWCRWPTATTSAARSAIPASACGLFGLKPTRARNPLGPEYGDAVSGWAVEHALTRSVRDSAALLDATAGPAPGDPYPAPPAGPAVRRRGRRRPRPAAHRLHRPRPPTASAGHPDCVAALDDAVALCASLGHELVEADLPGLDARGRRGDRHGLQRRDRLDRRLLDPPARPRARAEDELEPLTRAYWEHGPAASPPPTTCWPSRTASAFARSVAALPRPTSTCG